MLEKRGRDRLICTMCRGVNLDQRAAALKIFFAQAKERLEPDFCALVTCPPCGRAHLIGRQSFFLLPFSQKHSENI